MKKVCHIHICAAVCCAAVISAVYAAFGLYPFGEKTLSWCDMSQQVIPLMMELKDVLTGRAGWFLNLQNAGGMSFWGVFFFFLASPLNLLVLFVEKGDIYLLVNVLVLIKLSLSALTASVFFKTEAPRLPPPAHLALCLSYGLCGYGLMYYQNLVWLDVLCLFPLTMLGFLRLIEKGKSGLLTLCLTLSVIINYYLSYMLFLAMIILGAVFIFTGAKKERRGELAGKLGLSAAGALLMTAAVWLPSLLQCLSSARTDKGVVQSIQSGGLLTNIETAMPVLMCTIGAASLPLIGRFFPKTPRARAVKICWVLTVIPMVIEPINKLWHMGSYQAFPVRYGYMPVFLGLWYLALGLGSQPKPGAGGSRPLLLAPVLALPVISGAYILCARFEEISSYTSKLWVSKAGALCLALFWLTCLAALLGVCRAYSFGPSRRLGSWALLCIVLIQSAVQLPAFIGSAANLPSKSLEVISSDPIEDKGLYRVKQEKKFCHVNLLGGMGYPTLNHYTSLTDARFLAVMKKLGYSSYWMETSGCCGTGASDILLSNKYILDGDLNWRPTGSGNLGYIVPSGTLPETLELKDRLQLQNELCASLTGRELFTKYEPIEGKAAEGDGGIYPEEGSFRYEIPVKQRETLYFDAFDCISTSLREAAYDGFTVKVNGDMAAESYPTQRCNGILDLGSFENETVRVEITVRKPLKLCSFGVWGLRDTDMLARSLPNADLRYEHGRITGSAGAESGQSLFLSVPWYDGMRVQVNGRTVQVRQVLDCFMEIPLSQGHNEITVSYIPAGLIPGAVISVTAVLLAALYRLLREKRPVRAAAEVWNRHAQTALKLGFAAVMLIVYLSPLVIWTAKFI